MYGTKKAGMTKKKGMTKRKPTTLVGKNLAKKKAEKLKAERKSTVISSAEQKARKATRSRQEAKLEARKAGITKKKGMPKALVGKQKNLPDAIKKAIKAAPATKKKGMTKKTSPYNMVKSMGSAGMVGKAGTAKPPGGPKRTKSTTARKK